MFGHEGRKEKETHKGRFTQLMRVIYLGVWLGEGGRDREEEQVFGAERECAEPARRSPATSALMAPPPMIY